MSTCIAAAMEKLGAKTVPIDGLRRNLRAPITTEPKGD